MFNKVVISTLTVMNGLIKIPMQFFILLIGVLVFAFYQFNEAPVFFNKVETDRIKKSTYKEEFEQLTKKYADAHKAKQQQLTVLVNAIHSNDQQAIDAAGIKVRDADIKTTEVRKEVAQLMEKNNPKADTNDTNYIFLTFVTQQLPVGIVGLLIAIIFLASMGSTASGLNSLASTTVVDFYKRIYNSNGSESLYLAASRLATVLWGIFCVVVAIYANKLGNLIEAVNILGSLFYGTILGIFLVAFYMKRIQGVAVFYAALLAEAFIVFAWIFDLTAFLWLNVIGCALVMAISFVIQLLINNTNRIK